MGVKVYVDCVGEVVVFCPFGYHCLYLRTRPGCVIKHGLFVVPIIVFNDLVCPDFLFVFCFGFGFV